MQITIDKEINQFITYCIGVPKSVNCKFCTYCLLVPLSDPPFKQEDEKEKEYYADSRKRTYAMYVLKMGKTYAPYVFASNR